MKWTGAKDARTNVIGLPVTVCRLTTIIRIFSVRSASKAFPFIESCLFRSLLCLSSKHHHLRTMSAHQAARWTRSQEPACPDELQDVCLNDDTNDVARVPLPRGSRPECLKNASHECVFVALAALAAATPVFLQRSTVVITDSIAGALEMTPAELAWATAGSG